MKKRTGINWIELGNRIVDLRIERGYDQSDLSYVTGLPLEDIQDAEGGLLVDLGKMAAIFNALGVQATIVGGHNGGFRVG